MSRRTIVGGAIAACWLAGMALLARRELFRDQTERMALAATLIAPGAQYYTVTLDSARIGYASSTIDTSLAGIHIGEFLLAVLPAPGGGRRLAARSGANLTRGMRLTDFQYELGESFGPYRVVGRVDADSVLTLIVMAGGAPPDTTRIPLRGPLMLPSTMPLALLLDQRPTVGQQVTYAIYDPMTRTIGDATVSVKAESVFVVADSASYDTGTHRWVAALQDTVRAWRLEQAGGGILNGWVDEKGRLVQAAPLGLFAMRRTAYEMAYQNWSLDVKAHPRTSVPAAGTGATPTPSHD